MNRRNRALRVLLYLVYIAVLLEVSARAYWTLGKGVPFWRPAAILYFFYPDLESVAEEDPDPGSRELRVLLLGGSVLDDDHGRVGPSLQAALAERTGRPVAIRNPSEAGHTTLDTLHKYRHLGNQRFDWVVIYHGVNEVRANNIAAERFDPDYNHYSWYRRINALERHPELPYLALPYSLHYGWLTLDHRLRPEAYLPRHQPAAGALRHGTEIKTAGPFARNLERILEVAAGRGEKTVLMTFAYHVAAGYSLEAFREKRLDYGSHARPIELWGEPANVIAGLEAHNRAIVELAGRRPEAVFVDQHRLLPKSGELFDDLCHLTPEGSRLFASHVAERLGPP